MQRSSSLLMVAALAISSCSSLFAEEPLQPSLKPDAPPCKGETLFGRAQGIDCDIADGKLLAKALHYGQGRQTALRSAADGSEIREYLELNSDEGHVRLHFEAEHARHNLIVQIVDERHWQVMRRSSDSGEEITLRQPARGELMLMINAKLGTQQFHGASIWHLLLGESLACREATAALVNEIIPERNMQQYLTEVQNELLRKSPGPQPQEQWLTFVSQLSDESFATRQDADQALRAAGRPVVWFLSSLDPATLNAEQRQRIRHIQKDLTAETFDSPQLVAALVEGDVRVWLNLLATMEPEHRPELLAHVEQLLGQPAPIDLTADEAAFHKQIGVLLQRYAASSR